MKRDRTLYMAVSVDKYELPMALFLNYKEMAQWSGRPEDSLKCAVTRNQEDKKRRCKYVKVYLEEENE